MRAWRRENSSAPITVVILSALSQDKILGLLTSKEIELGLDVNIKAPLLFVTQL